MSVTYKQIEEDQIVVCVQSSTGKTKMPLYRDGDKWRKLDGTSVTLPNDVQWLTPEQKAAHQAAMEKVEFKHSRDDLMKQLVVTTPLGNKYQADPLSIQRLMARLIALQNEPDDFILQWSLADTDTGVMSDVPLGDLKAALKIATDLITEGWGRT